MSNRAIQQFAAKHPQRSSNPGAAPAEQIRRLLAAMLASPRTRVSALPRGRIRLRMHGYFMTLEGDTVVGYRTDHHERTWEEFQTGAPASRAGVEAERRRKDGQRARRIERRRAEMQDRVIEEGGTVRDLDAGSWVAVGPAGTMTFPPIDPDDCGSGSEYWSGRDRRATYRALADSTGLDGLGEHGQEDAPAPTRQPAGWLAID